MSVVQEALGTYNAPLFARQAIDYAYDHGVAVIASAADEAAEHHNLPGALPHTIVVNSVEGPADLNGIPITNKPPSYLQLDGCTNFGTRVELSVPATSCSSEATGKSAGVAGLIYSAALNACGAPLYGACHKGSKVKLKTAKRCKRADGKKCPITANEVRQLMAAGQRRGQHRQRLFAARLDRAEQRHRRRRPRRRRSGRRRRHRAETGAVVLGRDGARLHRPEPQHDVRARRGRGRRGAAARHGPLPVAQGLRRVLRLRAARRVQGGRRGGAGLDPAARPRSPRPTGSSRSTRARPSFAVNGYGERAHGLHLHGRSRARRRAEQRVQLGRRRLRPGALRLLRRQHGALARRSRACSRTSAPTTLRALFPHGDPASFTGNENGGLAQTSNGRPNTLPYAFTVRVVVSTAPGAPGPAMTGEDRRQVFLHRDQDMLSGFPLEMRATATPALCSPTSPARTRTS